MVSTVFTRLVTQKPMVTAGLKCPPEMCPRAETMMAMARPWASAMPRRPRPPAPCKYWSVQIEPAPKKISANVPRNSAISFCDVPYIVDPPQGKEFVPDSNGCILAGMRCGTPAKKGGKWRGDPRITTLASYSNGQSAGGGADGGAHWREPIVAVGLAAAGDSEEFRLQCECNRAGDALAHLDVIDGTDGRDFDGGANEKNFVGNVEHFARNDRFLDGNVEVLGKLDDGVAGDARQNAGGEWRSVKYAVVRKENVHARAFTDVAAGIERDAFGVAVERGFHSNELRIHVVGGGFGHGGKSVRGDARPGADADIDASRERVGTEIRAPVPAGHVNVDRRIQRIHSRFAVAAQHDGLHVTGVQFV